MRVEPYGVGSLIHVVKRGARGMRITTNRFDERRFLRLLFYMNDAYLDPNWEKSTYKLPLYTRPAWWPERKPITRIHAFTLMPNHMHLLLEEVSEGGISRFMQKLGQSMTNYHNEKYKQSGSLFQGSYKSKTIDSDEYLRYVSAYILVKNVFELFPNGGLMAAGKNFDRAWDWSVGYKFSSFGALAKGEILQPIDHIFLSELFPRKNEFRDFAHDVIMSGRWARESAFE